METRKKVAIIGAGISGLSCGVYLQRSGFEVSIYEQHSVAGGLSCSWKRNGFYFEGGMHWLTGSSPRLALSKIWKEVGAFKENNPILLRPIINTIPNAKKDGSDLNFYRDIDRTVCELCEFAPEDAKEIKKLFRLAKKFQAIHLPITDISGLKTTKKYRPGLFELISMAPAGIFAPYLKKISTSEYLTRFKNPVVRALIGSLNNNEYNALSFLFNVSSYSKGDYGFPKGGSARMTDNMVKTFTDLGGKILYRNKVEKVIFDENGDENHRKIKGIVVNGETVETENLVIAFDSLSALNGLLKDEIHEKWASNMQRDIAEEGCNFVGLGVQTDLSRYPYSVTIPLEKPFTAAGISYEKLRVYVYTGSEYAPEGSSTLTCLLLGSSYDFWKAKKAEGTYKEEKESILNQFCEIIENAIPEAKGKIIVRDLATALTYERYTSSWRGSYMSIYQPSQRSAIFPSKSAEITGLYFANERNRMPGGLPICAWSGRRAAQYICRDNKATFVCEDSEN